MPLFAAAVPAFEGLFLVGEGMVGATAATSAGVLSGMSGLSILTGLAGSAVSAFGQMQSAADQQAMAEYNAKVAEMDAKAALDKAKFEEDMHMEKVQRLLSSQRALYGKSGVSMEGSPLLVQEDTMRQGALDAAAIRYGGSIEAARQRSQANLIRMQGKSAGTAGIYSAGTTLLSGLSNAAGSYYKLKSA